MVGLFIGFIILLIALGVVLVKVSLTIFEFCSGGVSVGWLSLDFISDSFYLDIIAVVKNFIQFSVVQMLGVNSSLEFLFSYKFIFSIIDLVLMVYFVLIIFNLFIVRFSSVLFPSLYVKLLFKLITMLMDILIAQAGKHAAPFLPLLFSIFILIFCCNLFGLVPFFFCLTAQFFFTLLLSFSVFFGFTILGFQTQSYHFLMLFVPQNVPVFLLPFLILIEVVSYCSRAISLAVRLFANMVAGHVLLHILMGLCLIIGKTAQNVLILPIIFLFLVVLGAILMLELGIAFLQAYVFVVLCAIYLNDSLNPKVH